jgi:SAM-dependent methyltransferase
VTELAGQARAIIGYDVVREHLRSNSTLTAAVIGTGAQLPFADDTFDVVSANMVLEHLPDPVAVLAEISRVLQPGGCFVFVTPNRNHPVIRAVSILLTPRLRRAWARVAERRSDEHIFLTHYRANTLSALARAAERCGLMVDKLEGFYSYPMIRRPAIAVALECAWMRGLMWLAPRSLGSNLVGCLRKPGVRQPRFSSAIKVESVRAPRAPYGSQPVE